MDTSGDKPPQYDNSLIVLSSTQKSYKPHKVEPLASQKASYKASPKAASKQAQPATHTKSPQKTTYCLSCNKVFSIVSLVVMVLELA